MTKIIIDIFLYIFEVILLYYYSQALFPAKRSHKIEIIAISVVNVVLFIVYQYRFFYINTILMIILYAFVFAFLYKITIKTAIIHSVTFGIVNLSSDILIIELNRILLEEKSIAENNRLARYLLIVILSKFVYFVIMSFIWHLCTKKASKGEINKHYWLLFTMPIASIMILVAFNLVANTIPLTPAINIFLIISAIAMLFANLTIFIFYGKSLVSLKELYEIKALKREEKRDMQYFEIIEQSNNDMRILAHNMNNHLIQMRNLTNIDAIYDYIEHLTPRIAKFEATGISKNKMLDLIINKYIKLCEIKNINFSVDVKTANLSYIDDVDLSVLMNNLLDNAVESAEKSDYSFIKLNVFSKNAEYDALIIKNSCNTKPNLYKDELVTSKSDKHLHGIGISSINKIVKKYNAIYGWKYDENKHIFQTDIVFNKK